MIGVTSDGEPWVSKVLQTIRRLERDSKHVEILPVFGSHDREMLERACNLVTKLKKACVRSNFYLGFLIMSSA